MVRSVAFTVIGGNGQQDQKWDFQKKLGPAIEAAQNVTIWRNANVKNLVVSGGAVTRAEAQTVDVVGGVPAPGKVNFTVVARRFVLAAGGVETVRLLLLSGSPGSGAPLLGRTFMVHPVIWGLGRFYGGKPPSEAVRRFYSQQPELRIDPTLPPALVFAAMTPTDATLSRSPIGNFRAIVNFDGFGGGSIGMNWEQAPDPASTIRLDPSQRDVLGSPVVLLDWKLPQRDLDTARIGAEMVAQELKALGYASEYNVPSPTTIDTPGDHPMGATRMADSPRDGYVDANCRVHGVPNLYIASSSVFPTGGYANPTLTIIALAARLADHLISP
jgi:choline dehydrogenase-like flavoprotein